MLHVGVTQICCKIYTYYTFLPSGHLFKAGRLLDLRKNYPGRLLKAGQLLIFDKCHPRTIIKDRTFIKDIRVPTVLQKCELGLV